MEAKVDPRKVLFDRWKEKGRQVSECANIVQNPVELLTEVDIVRWRFSTLYVIKEIVSLLESTEEFLYHSRKEARTVTPSEEAFNGSSL